MMTNDKDSAVLAELLETMRERCTDPCRSEKAELGCDCDAARRAAVMLRQPTQSDENFHKLALSESFERVAKVAKERDAFNEQMPKPDPLVEALTKAGWGMPEINAKELRAALGAVGFEIREKGQ